MKFSEKWLREWVNPAIDTQALSEQLSMAGLEVDAVDLPMVLERRLRAPAIVVAANVEVSFLARLWAWAACIPYWARCSPAGARRSSGTFGWRFRGKH